MKDKAIVSGSASHAFSKALSKELNIKIANVLIKRFPDDECYVRILEELENKDVFLVQTTYPDKNIIELFLLQDAIKRLKPNRITTIIPYMGYARQDKIFNFGEPISSQKLAELISISSDFVYTIDIHEISILKFFKIPAFNVSAIDEISKHLKKSNIDIVLAPDKGAYNLAKSCAKIVKCDMDYLEKKRIDSHTVEITPKSLDVRGKNVAIVDDIISTGGTIAKAGTELKKHGAKKVYSACTHGIFVGNAIERLNSICDEIISTDTIENVTSVVSAAPSVAREIEAHTDLHS